jgi:hypothetical protein
VASKKTRAQLEAELNVLRRLRGSNAVASVLNNLIRWSGICGIFYFVYKAAAAFAGQHTAADLNVWLFGGLDLRTTAPWGVSLFAVVYGLLQRRLRRRNIVRMSARITELEMEVDTGRTSSNLAPHGGTNPLDT